MQFQHNVPTNCADNSHGSSSSSNSNNINNNSSSGIKADGSDNGQQRVEKITVQQKHQMPSEKVECDADDKHIAKIVLFLNTTEQTAESTKRVIDYYLHAQKQIARAYDNYVARKSHCSLLQELLATHWLTLQAQTNEAAAKVAPAVRFEIHSDAAQFNEILHEHNRDLIALAPTQVEQVELFSQQCNIILANKRQTLNIIEESRRFLHNNSCGAESLLARLEQCRLSLQLYIDELYKIALFFAVKRAEMKHAMLTTYELLNDTLELAGEVEAMAQAVTYPSVSNQ